MSRKSYPPEFKEETVSLILDQGYSYAQAQEATGVDLTALRRWVSQLRQERQGVTPSKGNAISLEHRRIQELEAQVKRLEREKTILKKASALLMSEAYNVSL